MKKIIFTLLAVFAMFSMVFLSGCGGGSSSNDNKQPTAKAPEPPTNVVATSDNGQATVSFSTPSSDGGSPITSYTVTTSPFNATTTGTTSPIIINVPLKGLTYSFTVRANNAAGSSVTSDTSNTVFVFQPFSTKDNLAWSIAKSGTEFFVPVERNRSVYLAKYDAAGKKLLEKPLLEATTSEDSYYCKKILTPTTDDTYLYAFCIKETVILGAGFRTSGDGILLKIRKSDLTVSNSKILFPRGEFRSIENYPGDTFFYALHTYANNGLQYLTKFDFEGNQLASRVLDFGGQTLQVGADGVFVGGDIMKPYTGSFNRLCVEKVSKDLGSRLWRTYYRSFDASVYTDISLDNGLTLNTSGLFMTGYINSIDAMTPSLVRWDPTTGAISLATNLIFNHINSGKVVSDTAGNIYVDLGDSIIKIGPDGTIVKQTLSLFDLSVVNMMIDGTKLFVASTDISYAVANDHILIFDTETMSQLN